MTVADFTIPNIRHDRQKLVDLLTEAGASFDGNKCRCIFHDDQHASAGVYQRPDGAWAYKCQGCGVNEDCIGIAAKLRNMTSADLLREARRASPATAPQPRKRIVAEYDYCNAEGELLYQAVRMEPKDFRQRTPDGNGGWAWKLNGVQRVLYRLPGVLNAREEEAQPTVYIVEGEKDADRLSGLGLLATCNVGGAGKWRDVYSETLTDFHCIVIPDNDDAGRKHAEQVARSLNGKAASVKVLELPGLLPKGDVSDWLDASGTRDELLRLAADAPLWTPPADDEDGDGADLEVGAADLRVVAKMQTDVGNAARFAIQHADRLRFVPAWGRWLIWTGSHWRTDDRMQAARLAKQTALSIYAEASREEDDGKRAALVTWAKTSQKRDRLGAMIELAKPELAITPDELDADVWLLNVSNGTIDLRTGQLRAHRREDYITRVCRAKYDPAATSPVFDVFLGRIFQTYPALIRYVQKALGYAITGLTIEQVMFFLYGLGANGKTTLLDAIMHILGGYGGKADRELLTATDGTAHPTNIADLMGRRLVVLSETNEGRRIDEAKYKDLVGETVLKARFMRQDFFSFTATHTLFAYSNHKPMVRGTDNGFWRRMRLIPFIETIGETERDPDLPAKLRAEADGILRWLVEGCLLWQREGLGLPDEVAQATDGYRREMDSIGAFLGDCCTFGDRLEASAKDLYAAYAGWCDDAGERPLSQKRLGMQLTERGLESGRCTYSRRTIWRGVGLIVSENVTNDDDKVYSGKW